MTLPKLLALSLLGGSMWTTAILPVVLIPVRQDPSPAASTSTETSKPASPRPNPDASGSYHIGDGVAPPKLVSYVHPEFPRKTRKEKFKGFSLVGLTVNRDGTPADVHLVQSIADNVDNQKMRSQAKTLDENAIRAVERYKFEPATYEGAPVAVKMNISVNFQIF